MLTLKQNNRFAILDLVDSIEAFQFLRLPRELRNKVYEFIADSESKRKDYGLYVYPNSCHSTENFLAFALTCRQVYTELSEVKAQQTDWHLRLDHCLYGPRRYPPVTEREHMIIAHARTYRLVGYFRKRGPRTDRTKRWAYEVNIVFSRDQAGYKLVWHFARHECLEYYRITSRARTHQELEHRVEWAVAAMVQERRELDGVAGLTMDGLASVIDAFYLNDDDH